MGLLQFFQSTLSAIISSTAKLTQLRSPPHLDTCVDHAPVRNEVQLLRLSNLSSLADRILAYIFPSQPIQATRITILPSKTITLEELDVDPLPNCASLYIALSIGILVLVCLLSGYAVVRRRLPRKAIGRDCRIRILSFTGFLLLYLRVVLGIYWFAIIIVPALSEVLSIRLLRGTYRTSKFAFQSIITICVFLITLFLHIYDTIRIHIKPIGKFVTTFVQALWCYVVSFCCRTARNLLTPIWNYEEKATFVLGVIAVTRLIPTAEDISASYSLAYYVFPNVPRPAVAIAVTVIKAFGHTLPFRQSFVAWVLWTSSRIYETFVVPALSHCWRYFQTALAILAEWLYVKTFQLLGSFIIPILDRFFDEYIYPLYHRSITGLYQLLQSAWLLLLFHLPAFGTKKPPDEDKIPQSPEPWTEIAMLDSDNPDGAVRSGLKLSELQLHGVYGSGSFGSVHRAFSPSTGKALAMKVCRKLSNNYARTQHDQVLIEARIMNAMQGTSLFPVFYGVYESSDSFAFVMKAYEGGTLHARIHNHGPLRLPIAQKFSAQLLLGIHHLHRCGIIHRDIKPNNILVQGNENIIITDFGLSHWFPECYDEYWQELKKFSGIDWPPLHPDARHPHQLGARNSSGTPGFIAPEVHLGLPYSYGVDWWSFGATVHFMFTGVLPLVAIDLRLVSIKRDYGRPQRFPPVAVAFLEKVLAFSPGRRLTVSAMMNDPFFVDVDWRMLKLTLLRK